MERNLSIARHLACPVVLISSALEGEQEHGRSADFYMLSSISYVNLDPVVISTAFLKTSKTGAAAISNKTMALSVLSFQQLQSVQKLESQTASEKDGRNAVENLNHCGFASGRLKSGLLYVRNSLLALGLRIIEQTELNQYIVVLAKVEETAATEECKGRVTDRANQEPLIRYNRLYATIDQERLSQGNDRYPV